MNEMYYNALVLEIIEQLVDNNEQGVLDRLEKLEAWNELVGLACNG